MNRTQVKLACTMLLNSNLPKFLWAEAINHAIWIKNHAPHFALNGKTPYKIRYNKKPDMSKVMLFGTKAWVKKVDAGKLEARAKPGFFVSFNSKSKGY